MCFRLFFFCFDYCGALHVAINCFVSTTQRPCVALVLLVNFLVVIIIIAISRINNDDDDIMISEWLLVLLLRVLLSLSLRLLSRDLESQTSFYQREGKRPKCVLRILVSLQRPTQRYTLFFFAHVYFFLRTSHSPPAQCNITCALQCAFITLLLSLSPSCVWVPCALTPYRWACHFLFRTNSRAGRLGNLGADISIHFFFFYFFTFFFGLLLVGRHSAFLMFVCYSN